MTRLLDLMERLTFTINFKGQVSIGQVWVKTQIKSKPNVRPASVVDRDESYAVFANEDWRSPFVQYLTEGMLPQKNTERYKLKRLETLYFVHNEVLFKKGYP